MYFIPDRTIESIHPIIKTHCPIGSVIISDEHATYLNVMKASSKLTQMGFFHYWTNHSAQEYVHKKLPFIYSLSIEGQWNLFKSCNRNVHHYRRRELIDQVCAFWSAYKVIKKEKIYEFTLKQMS
jgi:hypothetical protein